MVLQLSLVSAIDDESYDLCVSTLSSLSGNPPILFGNFTAMLKPNPAFDIEQVNSKNQLIEQNRIKLCTSLPLEKIESDESKQNYKVLKQFRGDQINDFDLKLLQDMLNSSSDPDAMDVDSENDTKRGSGPAKCCLLYTSRCV